jgi:osmotically-inducible protein OsmY
MSTDTQLQQKVMAQLGWEPAVNAEKRVTGRARRLIVKLPEQDSQKDADIACAAENALKWWTYLPINAVKVKVNKGWITLSGEVERDYQRLAAADAVRRLMGVTGISDIITINPKAFEAWCRWSFKRL